METLRRKGVYNHEAAEFLQDAEQHGPPARWYGRGCQAAGFGQGSQVHAYYLNLIAGHLGTQDVTCPGDDPAAIAAALEASGEAPAPDMGEDWMIATFPHGAWQCPQWPFPHVHSLIVMGTPADIRRAIRDQQEATSRTW